MSRYTPPKRKRSSTPGDPRVLLAQMYGVSPNSLQPYDGDELLVGVPIINDGQGNEWKLVGVEGHALRAALRQGCDECDEDH